jgi:lipopolysaccharide/colanic/teichoic acid biosynthesis glycosyltransferase
MPTQLLAPRTGQRTEVGLREHPGDRLEGLLAARPLVEPLVGQGYLMWVHLASPSPLVGAAASAPAAVRDGAPVIDLTLPEPWVVPSIDRARGDRSEANAVYCAAKAVGDRLLAAVALVVMLPLLALVALAVKLSSPGPVLFRQARVGRGSTQLKVLKFRTMVADAEARLHEHGLWERYVANGFKLPADEDPRITRLGRFLRKTSLDELPQIVNVLKGEMSFVGPRPVVPTELDQYGSLSHCYLGVRPGITGLWQVTGRSTIGFPQRADLDAEYYRTRSLATDLRILARTPLVVLRCTGAY